MSVDTDTAELQCLLGKCLAGTRVHPLGVFAADMVPYQDALRIITTARTNRDAVAFIVNTDKASRPGEHWVAFLLLRDGRLEFFDSYGLQLSDYHNIASHMVPAMPAVTKHNSVCLQSLDTSSCGQYCILYIYARARGATFTSFVNALRAKGAGSRRSRDAFVERSVAKLRRLVPCVADRCPGSTQCCVKQLCYRTRHAANQ